ncbi:MAG: MBL fold metallo-hydrolase, partial [Gemmataceae bacterium]
FSPPAVQADLICLSHRERFLSNPELIETYKAARVLEGVKAPVKNRPGEFQPIDEKIGGIRFRTLSTAQDTEDGAIRGRNAVFVVECEGLSVCHLGSLGHELSRDLVKQIGAVDLLMVPVGGVSVLNGDVAKKVVADLNPKRLIVPMMYGTKQFDELLTPDEFLEGQKGVRKTPASNEISIPVKASAGGAMVVVPGWKSTK